VVVTKKETAISRPTPRTNKWACHKLESFSEFLDSYQPQARKAIYCYLELFAGVNIVPCQGFNCSFEGTFQRALNSKARFARYAFLTRSRASAKSLQTPVTSGDVYEKINILYGNQNNITTISRLLDTVPRSASSLAFIDPAGYRQLDWSTLKELAGRGKNWQGDKMDLLIIFPLEMALLRNLMRSECEKSITRFYGNQRWEDIKRQSKVQKLTAGDIKNRLVELFKTGLFELGYRYVEDFRPAAPTADPYYHLIFASDMGSRLKYLKESWGKPRYLKCELLFEVRPRKSK
jgi:three-Cys-motif partner protein